MTVGKRKVSLCCKRLNRHLSSLTFNRHGFASHVCKFQRRIDGAHQGGCREEISRESFAPSDLILLTAKDDA